MCGFFPKINKRLICDHSLREMSVCAAAFTTVFSLVGMGMHYHGMHNPNVTQISYYKEYHTIICIIIICTFGFLFVSSIVFAIGIQEVFSLVGMGMHYHGMHNPNVTQISYYKEYHTIICIIIICTFGFLFVSSIVFAIGIQEQWPLLYIPWLMAYTMVTVLVLAQLVYLIVDNFLLPHILLGFQACINIFAIWIGCNFYEETREKVKAEKKRQRDQRQVTRESATRYSDY